MFIVIIRKCIKCIMRTQTTLLYGNGTSTDNEIKVID